MPLHHHPPALPPHSSLGSPPLGPKGHSSQQVQAPSHKSPHPPWPLTPSRSAAPDTPPGPSRRAHQLPRANPPCYQVSVPQAPGGTGLCPVLPSARGEGPGAGSSKPPAPPQTCTAQPPPGVHAWGTPHSRVPSRHSRPDELLFIPQVPTRHLLLRSPLHLHPNRNGVASLG